MKCCAVIDTNVLVSALLSSNEEAATVQVAERLLSGEILPLYSDSILSEYSEVLHRKKWRNTAGHERLTILRGCSGKAGGSCIFGHRQLEAFSEKAIHRYSQAIIGYFGATVIFSFSRHLLMPFLVALFKVYLKEQSQEMFHRMCDKMRLSLYG